jgi:hypothetical protein
MGKREGGNEQHISVRYDIQHLWMLSPMSRAGLNNVKSRTYNSRTPSTATYYLLTV